MKTADKIAALCGAKDMSPILARLPASAAPDAGYAGEPAGDHATANGIN